VGDLTGVDWGRKKGGGGLRRKRPVVFGRSEEKMERVVRPSTPAAAGAAEVANASNCGHFYNDFSSLRVPIATGRGVTFGPYQSQGGSHPIPCFRSHSGQR
jgi:hypothetical protein